MTAGRWIPGWTDTHTQALAPLDFEPHPDKVEPAPFRDDIESGEVWPEDCTTCGAPRTEWEAKTWPDICSDCARRL